jgi:hypothetical protein
MQRFTSVSLAHLMSSLARATDATEKKALLGRFALRHVDIGQDNPNRSQGHDRQ